MSEDITLPKHVGIIMDGNRRWAKSQGLSTLQGHTAGQETLRNIAEHAFKSGVKYVSVYAFSTENWQRTEEEVGYLMKLMNRALKKYVKEFDNAGIKLVILGTREGLDKGIIKTIEETEEKTKNNTKGTLAVCFNYGGHREIIDAVQKIVSSGTPAESIDEKLITEHLYHAEVPPIDLVIRTSGEQRISNFMLWRAAYSELYFVEKHWPDFKPADLDQALADYSKRKRRFGA